MRICHGEEYIQMKEFIYQKYLKNSDNIEEITSLIDNIFFESGLNYIIDIETFLNILDKNKDNFFDKNIKSNKENLKHIIQLKKYSKDIKVENEPPISGQSPPITLSDPQKSSETKKESVKEILKDLAKIEKKMENKYIFNIIKNIESLIAFSREKKAFLVYFTNNFWKHVLYYYNESKYDNIYICYKLREIFFKYYDLCNEIFKDKDEEFTIKKEAINYFEKDEFAFLLDQIIRKYINNPEVTNIEKLTFIAKFNPYYMEIRYCNKVDCDIFDALVLDYIDNIFIEDFKQMNFEKIFKDNISDYIKKFFEKINNIQNFDTVIQLINIKNLENKNIYLDLLNKKYDNIISNEIELLTDEKLKEAIHVIAKIAFINYEYEKKEKKFYFINKRVKKLDRIAPLIFIEIINIYFNKDDNDNHIEKNKSEEIEEEEEEDDEDIDIDLNYNRIKKFIFKKFINKMNNENDIDNIIKLIDCLERKNIINGTNKKERIINEFLPKLIEKYLFTKDEFFSCNQNIKITLFYKLYAKEKIKKNEIDNYENLINLLNSIKKDLEGDIKKSKLEEFLKNEQSLIKQRLSLIKLILEEFNPDEQYDYLKKINNEINEDLNTLKYIKDNIIIYHRDCYQHLIKRIIEVIKNDQDKKIIDYKVRRIEDLIKEIEIKGLKDLANKINEVKNVLLFNIMYEMNSGKDENKKFEIAYDKLKEIKEYLQRNCDVIKINDKYKDIFMEIKEKLSNNEDEDNDFTKNMIKYFEIESNTDLINDLTILLKTKKYEMDINSIFFFFENFELDNKDWNDKLPPIDYKKKWEENFQNIKKDLNRLKENEIYDYKNIRKYNKLFTCLYDKKEAIDFLFLKTSEEIIKLKDKIQPTDRAIKIKDIIDTENCISIINKMKTLKDNFKIFDYIKKFDDKTISQFENYSKIYSSIIELDNLEDDSDNVYDKVINIIRDATINILQDTEILTYKNKNNEEIKKEGKIMEELLKIKNQIHIIDKNENYEDDIIKSKCQILICFKSLMSNLEVINEYMKVLRLKGSSLPIKIKVKISIKNKEPIIDYFLDKEKKDFQSIREFLFQTKNAYVSQLDKIYKEKLNLRFLYGKQFRTMMKHLEYNYKIDSFLRYILNITNNDISIIEGYKSIIRSENDYIKQYNVYNEDSLINISAYIYCLFKNNNKTIEEHYQRMKIKSNDLKGIFLHKCEKISMEEYIINLFLDKLDELPISQNILIANKETSSEEIQAFLHRSILCNYYTLFVVEINDSFSEYQQNIMGIYIDNLLSYKNDEYNRANESENIDKKSTEKYLDSCIFFIYDNNNNCIPFLKEIENYSSLGEKIKRNPKNKIKGLKTKYSKDKYYNLKKGNIFVITSEICGLGKSEKIKKKVKEKNKSYFYFPLGGALTKKTIFDKLEKLLNEIEIKKTNKKYEDIAIHLDLTESEETSILNEFFFSFLITRFYANDDKIIYIPKDIYIYIEIPNCFEDYLSKFSILNIFDRENITFENMPPFNYQEEIIYQFKILLGINSNEEMQEFVQKYIGVEKYSYYQINIFINLFLSHFGKFQKKLKFLQNGEDITYKCIWEFANGTKYFTNGGFAQLSTRNIKMDKKDFIDILSVTYANDLYNMTFLYPLIFIIPEKMIYDKLYISKENLNNYITLNDYLERLKIILSLPYSKETLLFIIKEKNNNYVITNNNFQKMVLLIYRIKANIPVILMGELGCGKTTLIKKLNQILNGGRTTLKIINIHPGITEEIICEKMKEANKEAEDLKKEDKDFWVFFNEMNTCLSLSLLEEIFINRNYNGKKISDNIRLIGSCNPYRKRKRIIEKYGLSLSDDNENDYELVYLVNPLPQSLLYYVFSFGSINETDEKKYIYSIIEKFFIEEEQYLQEMTSNAIFECHSYLRRIYDLSIVSLREIAIFSKCLDFFKNYFTIKNKYEKRVNNEKNNKLRSIICSIYLCYYVRLINQEIRFNFEMKLKPILLKLVNYERNIDDRESNLMEQIKNQDLKNEIERRPEETINNFSDFLRIEQDYIINQIELDKGIGKNYFLKENIFLLFFSLLTSIPLIIIGKPGIGKSLSVQLIYKSMRGKYSKNKFFQQFPEIIQIYFQGSEFTKPEDVERLFKKAESKLKALKEKRKKEEVPIIMVLFNHLELAERSSGNPFNVLNEKLEYTSKEEGVSFIGISNYSLDTAKINRALIFNAPDLDQIYDELIKTTVNIVESISDKLKKEPIFEIISKTYFEYKKILHIIKELIVYKRSAEVKNKQSKRKNLSKPKERKIYKFRKDFHGNHDFYNLIKGIAIELKYGDSTDIEKVEIINKYIERNFGGMKYKINIDLDLEDTKKYIELNKNIIEDYDKEKKILKLNSVFLFKKLYNLECEKIDSSSNLKIDNLKINDYNLKNYINTNIKDAKRRHLLLEIKPSLIQIIYQTIKYRNPFKKIVLYNGSPFIDDNNKENRFKIINKIKEDAKEDKLIVIENFNQIHPFLYDLYNMNYIIKDDKKLVRVCFDYFNEQLTFVNEKFRVIILVDRRFVNYCDLAFLSRFEKMVLSFDKLLDNDLKKIFKNLKDDIKLRDTIKKYKNINYSLRDLLINSGDEDIQAMIYYFGKITKMENNENNEVQDENKINIEKIRENVINKIYKILPQDIICILPESNIVMQYYIKNTIFYNIKDYINEEENKKYKISIIYTFTSINSRVKGLNKEMSFMVSEIKSEDGLKELIEEIKYKNGNNKLKKEFCIFINFKISNSKNILFISNFILNNFKEDNYNYIFIVHIKRCFNLTTKERLNSLLDINPSINQIFIDNLNGNNKIVLKELMIKNITEILNSKKEDMKLNEEFYRTLINTLTKELNYKHINVDDYIDELQNFMIVEETIKEKIIEVAYKLIDKNKNNEVNYKDIIEKIYKNNYINQHTIDITSCLIEYIKENIFNDYIKKVLLILEDNNILTTLIELKKNDFKEIDKSLAIEITKKYLDEITSGKNEAYPEPKFLFNYNVPGLYKFYKDISNFINKNIIPIFFNNEKKLRETLKFDIENIGKFHDIEDSLLNYANNYIANNKYVNEILNKIPHDLILKDYITFYLQKYRNKNDVIYKKDDAYHKLIELLLKLRFKDDRNKNSLLIKMIWIESNVNYILNILKIFDISSPIFNNNYNKFYNKIEELINEKKKNI